MRSAGFLCNCRFDFDDFWTNSNAISELIILKFVDRISFLFLFKYRIREKYSVEMKEKMNGKIFL